MTMLRWLEGLKALAGVDIGGLECLKCGAARCGAASNTKNKSFAVKRSIQWRVYPQAFAQDGYSATARHYAGGKNRCLCSEQAPVRREVNTLSTTYAAV